MYYKVKSKDTLSKIAKSFSIPIELILAHNPTIKNVNQIYVNQQIYIPNIEDIPSHEFEFSTISSNDLVLKAKTAINKGIRYKLGSGGMNPNTVLPTTNKLCDCSGFVCWVLGISRKSDNPFYAKFGGWIYTDSMVIDINSQAGLFEKLNTPEVGCIVVYGAGGAIGHVGLVSKVENGQMTKVIHCSSGNDRNFNDSIQETNAAVFNRADTVFGKFTG
jgi:hypothetical protein